MAGKTRSRTSEFPIDHPGILMAAPSTGGDGELPPRMKKALRTLHRTALVTTAAARFRRWLDNCPAPKWFHPSPTILRQQGFTAGDGIADDRPLDWRAAAAAQPDAAITIFPGRPICRQSLGTMSICAVPTPRRPQPGLRI